MSAYKTLLIENEQLREIVIDAQNEIDKLVEFLEYTPEPVNKQEVILRLGWLDLPPLSE